MNTSSAARDSNWSVNRWLERRYSDGYLSDDAARVGWALVQAAVDWRRVGMFRAIKEVELRQLARLYLPANGPWTNPDEVTWATGLRWALAEPHNAPVALLLELRPHGTDRRFQAFDHIVSYADDPQAQIPDSAQPPVAVWEFALVHADALEVMQLAVTAGNRHHEEASERAWQYAESAGDPLLSSFAAFSIAQKLEASGDLVGAQDAYMRAINSTSDGPGAAEMLQRSLAWDNLDDASMAFASFAAVSLGTLLNRQGDRAGATALFQRAMGMNDRDGSLVAKLSLAEILLEDGDKEGARLALLRTVDSVMRRPTELALNLGQQALYRLGSLFEQMSDPKAAEDAYHMAMTTPGDTKFRSLAAWRLSQLLRNRGNHAEALAALHVAATSADPDLAAAVTLDIGEMSEQSDPAAAEAAYRKLLTAGASSIPEIYTSAMLNLGSMMTARGDLKGAQEIYRGAAESGNEDAAAMASFHLAKLAERRGALAEAKRAYRRAAISHSTDAAPLAAYDLGTLLLNSGDVAGAESAYRQVMSSGHARLGPKAQVALGVVLRRRGDVAGAVAAYQRAIDSGNAEAASSGQFNLGRLLHTAGHTVHARAAYRRAIDSGDPDAGPFALYQLGNLLMEEHDLLGARDAFLAAADSGHQTVVPMALIGLGDVLVNLGDTDGARAAFSRATQSNQPDAVSMATSRLDRLAHR
ncbi:MAG TPA: tetratricopeptide repeat protein [Mycobacterium sp.]